MAKILVADDRAINREFLATLLGYRQHQVLEAGDGAEALEVVRRERPALVISDLVMPTMDGYEFVRHLRTEREIANTPVVFYTAKYEEREAQDLLKAGGVIHFLRKPAEPEEILRVIEQALGSLPVEGTAPLQPEAFDRAHLRLVTDKLAEQVNQLEVANRLLQAENQERRKAERRLWFLSEATRVLASSLEYDRNRAAVARLAASAFADCCKVITLEQDGRWQESVYPKPEGRGFRPRASLARVTEDVLRHGESRVLYRLSPGEGEAVVEGDPDLETLVREKGLVSFICLPMVIRERVVGAIALLRLDGSPEFEPADHEVAQELSFRAAAALDNARLYRQANQAIQTRDEFISVASHELKTPITAMRLQTEMVERSLRKSGEAAPDREKVNRFLDTSLRQLGRLTRLVEDMLDVSRISTGKFVVEPVRVDLGNLVKEVVTRFCEQLAANECHVRAVVEPEVIGHWDHLRIEQVVSNLLTNAIKYAPQSPIDIYVKRKGEVALLTVRDYGQGVPKEHQDRIFQRFERAVEATKVTGLGLGLYIVRQIVGLHGGSVRLESDLEKGAAFIVELPLDPVMGREGHPERKQVS